MKRNAPHEDIVIVGGGLAGASAACLLARAGRPALLIEREAEPRHKVCGEFLSIEAQVYLAHLGIDLDMLGASRIAALRLIHGSMVAEVGLPFTARGLSRKTLDEALLQRAVSAGARLLRGIPVRSLSTIGSSLRADAGEAGEIQAPVMLLATGKHDVRGAKRPSAGAMEDMIGFKAHYSLAPGQRSALEGHIEVILFDGGYAGLQMIEHGIANLCLVMTRRCFEQVGKNWPNLLDYMTRESPHLRGRLEGATAIFERPLSIFQIPYGFIHAPHPAEPKGLFRIGDQAGVIPSYTGDGMSIALHSGCLAASILVNESSESSTFHRQIKTDIHRQIRLASLLYEAGRRPAGRWATLQLCRAWPAAMRWVASLTRVRENSVRRLLEAS